ncbi:MAG: ArdC family protein [Bryobacteraceae bacterium]
MRIQSDVYEAITAVIIEAIEAGVSNFEMPWHTLSQIPTNACTGRKYTGINILVLWSLAAKCGYSTQLWATYQQWKELGAQVRQGQKSATVVFWKFFGAQQDAADSDQDESDADQRTETRCFARAYHVFNADQVDGFSVPALSLINESERIQEAETFFRNAGARVIENGSRAYYDWKSDEIHMPPFHVFKRPDLFYSTLAHETIHFTGHESRCNRQLGNRFGSEAYAAEELIAELGSAFLSAELSLETEPRFDHAPYVENWLRVLKSDKRAIFTAASKAQQGAQFLTDAQHKDAASQRRSSQQGREFYVNLRSFRSTRYSAAVRSS